jgi:hypothetical protein
MTILDSKKISLLSCLAIPVMVIGVEAAAWKWMNPSHDDGPVAVPTYVFRPEEGKGRYGAQKNEKILEALGADDVFVAELQDQDYFRYQLHDVQWNDPKSLNVSQVLAHRPEICLGTAGAKLDKIHPVREWKIGKVDLVFDVTEFKDADGGSLFVYKAPWINGFNKLDLRQGIDGLNWLDDTRQFRMNAVKKRFKPRFARVLMCTFFFKGSEAEAWQRVSQNVLKDISLKNLN